MGPHHTHKFSGHYCVECGCMDTGRGMTWEPCPGAASAVAVASKLHGSHDWSFFSASCTACGCMKSSLYANIPCQPSTDDSAPEPAPKVVDWFATNKDFS